MRTAGGVGPTGCDVAELTLFLLDQDGASPDDDRRPPARGHRRPARRGGKSTVTGELTPEGAGGVGGDLRQVRRAGDVQPR